MAELVHLPSLTELKADRLLPGAYPLLAQLPLLRDLHVTLEEFADPAVSQSQREEMDDGLGRCLALTRVCALDGALTEADGARLLRSLPHLRELHLLRVSLPSLEFLQRAPQLVSLRILSCRRLRPTHLMLLGHLAPALTDLHIWRCAGVELDALELRVMTPPCSALLPQLRNFSFQEP